MRRFLLMSALLLAGCASPQAQTNGGDGALTAVGTPVLAIAKIPICILTLAVAAPVGAASELSDPDTAFGHEVRTNLGDGIASNCGPPDAVTP